METEKKSWLEVSMTVDNEIAEAVAEVLSRFAENGVVVERGMDYNDAEDIGTPFGPCHVYGYLPMDDETEEKKSRIMPSPSMISPGRGMSVHPVRMHAVNTAAILPGFPIICFLRLS